MSARESASTHATPLSKTDEDLAREAAAGEMYSFEELVRRRRSELVRFLASFTQSAAAAEDLVQETFLRAYRNLANYDPRKPVRPWLYLIARRLAINLFRKRERQRETTLQEGKELQGENPFADELGSLWNGARKLLSPDAFTAIRLHYAEDMPVKEIAQVLQKSVTATKVMLFRARRILAQKLDSGTYEPKA